MLDRLQREPAIYPTEIAHKRSCRQKRVYTQQADRKCQQRKTPQEIQLMKPQRQKYG